MDDGRQLDSGITSNKERAITMAETKPLRTDDQYVRNERGEIVENTGRLLRTVEQTINDPPPPPTPTQEELDAIMLGEYVPDDIEQPAPESETPEARERREKREEDKRQRREAKAQADQQAGYQTR